jgi:catechol 2,3-dioxygenase-like lactoylglutathione lyase family enzyme
MKTHLNLATKDLPKSVAFYSTLLDATPAKVLDDYALFVTEDPGLELALDLREAVAPGHDVHYGIFVASTDEVDRAIDRLAAAGLSTSVERAETCCYANQTKVWATDPEGRRWEIYTVHADIEERSDASMSCCSPGEEDRTCCLA